MNTSDELRWGRVVFRPTRDTDLDFVLRSEQHHDNCRYIRQWSEEQHREAIDNPDIGHFIIEAPCDRRPVGHVILVGLTDRDFCLELKRIVVAEKGRGYGRDAVRLVMMYAFEKLAFHRLWLDVMDTNKRAFKLYKSEGFCKEGVHREAVRYGTRYVSVKVMSILRNEYFSRSYFRPTRLLTDAPGTDRLGTALIT